MGRRRGERRRIETARRCRPRAVDRVGETRSRRCAACAPDALGNATLMRAHIAPAVMAWELAVLAYFLTINSIDLLFCVIAYIRLREHRRRWTPRSLEAVMRSPATPGISVIAPGYNEEATICESVRSLLHLNYPQFEVVVVNDGSKDSTLAVLQQEFELVPAPMTHSQPIRTQTVRGVYRSRVHTELVVVDKENGGGKA